MSSTPGVTLSLRSAAVSGAGPRPDNQDSGCAGSHLIAVADGVGGNAGGAIASSLVINRLSRHDTACGTTVDGLSAAIAEANQDIRTASTQQPRLRTMATTLTAIATTADGGLALAHVGDSRAYLVRDDAIVQLTRDYTWVQALEEAGIITPEQAVAHPLRSVLLAVLHGGEDDVARMDISPLAARPGDRLLLCSDGVSGVVSCDQMRHIVADVPNPADAAALLLHAALEAPAQDNVTVVVADVTARPHALCAAPTRVGAAAARADTSALPASGRADQLVEQRGSA